MYEIINDIDLSDPAEICRQWSINKRHTDSVFARTMSEASNFSTGEEWLKFRRGGEEEVLKKMEAAGEDVKFKNGKFNYSKLGLGSNYRSSKSTISRAIDLKINLKKEDGTYLGKTALEKLVASKPDTDAVPTIGPSSKRRSSAVTLLSADEAAGAKADWIKRNWDILETETQDKLRGIFSELL